MQGEWINVASADGGSFTAYLAKPEKGCGPGILLCQEIFGVNAQMRAVADEYAGAGYAALVPDLFWRLEPGVQLGYGEADLRKAFALLEKFDEAAGMRDITAAVQSLRAHPACKGKIGALGFCLGGKLAVLAASRSGVDCAVSYYGVGIESLLDEVSAIAVPLMLHFAGRDKYVPPAAVEAIRKALRGRPVQIHVYPECDHGFNSPGRPSHDPRAARTARSHTLALFREQLVRPDAADR
ncbi:MAG TPA: dienelactone hydrolase family protein [Burkholderiales bacterium]|nr:dienelactone hydrolase family protein [Burkholderiales bacterium]